VHVRKDLRPAVETCLTRRWCVLRLMLWGAVLCCWYCVDMAQEEKKAMQDAMIAKIVAEVKRKQAEEEEMIRVSQSVTQSFKPTGD
jgi:alkylhydroperoxidase family enzyme